MIHRFPDSLHRTLFPQPGHTGHAPGSGGTSGGFIERTVMGALSFLKDAISNEELARRRGLLQQCDPRAKTVSILLLLCATMFSRALFELFVLYGITLLAVMLSRISPGTFFKRTLLFIPLFTFFVAVPSMLNVVTPGEPVVSVSLLGRTFSITREGVAAAGEFLLRVTVSVSLAVLLTLTTRHHVLLRTLRTFGVPHLFVMTMGMTYRYIFLLLDIIQNTLTGIKSRVGSVRTAGAGQRLAGLNIATLWLRSYRMQSQVYDAMIARGYTGEPRTMFESRLRPADLLLTGFSLTMLIGIVCLNRFLP